MGGHTSNTAKRQHNEPLNSAKMKCNKVYGQFPSVHYPYTCPVPPVTLSRMLLFFTICAAVLLLPTVLSAPTRCSLVAGDAARRAAAAAQVLEAEVATSPTGRNVYTAALTVRRVLRRYRGPGRLKKHDTITLTLQRAAVQPCVAVASLQVGRRYFVFMDGPARRRIAPKAVAAPLPYNRRGRRLIRQLTCSKCGGWGKGDAINVIDNVNVVVFINLVRCSKLEERNSS